MKRLCSGYKAVLLTILMGGMSIYAQSPDEWQYARAVYFDNTQEVKAIYLDEDIYRLAKDDLSDIRLVNERNEFIPYYINNQFLTQSKEEHHEYKGKALLSFKKGNDVYSDYEITPIRENSDVVGNKLNVEIDENSFYKEVQILGSYDSENWESIKTDMIYRVNGVEKLTMLLDEEYKYLYYRIISINDTSGIAIKALSLAYDTQESIYGSYTGAKEIDYEVETNKENKQTVVKLHNKDKLKINSINIKSQGDFKRAYRVYSADDQGNRLERVAEGEIYSFDLESFTAKHTIIPMEEEYYVSSQYIQIVIEDRDDYPVDIQGIEISYYRDKVVFKSKSNEEIYLLFGNDEVSAPNYDIGAYIEEVEKVDQEQATLSPEIEQRMTTKPQPEQIKMDYKWILNGLVVVVSIFLITLIIRKSKIQSKDE